MPITKRTWKFWVSRTVLLVLLIGSGWLINLIWFRPFSIGQFYNRFQKTKQTYATLQSYDFESQSEANQLNTKILSWYIKGELDREPFFLS